MQLGSYCAPKKVGSNIARRTHPAFALPALARTRTCGQMQSDRGPDLQLVPTAAWAATPQARVLELPDAALFGVPFWAVPKMCPVDFLPVPYWGGIYMPCALGFSNDERFTFSAVALQRVLTPRDIPQVDQQMRNWLVPQLVKRIDAALAIAVRHGHRHVIFGAWGCDAPKPVPHSVAHAFRKAIQLVDGAISHI
jgi:hypothetical protein